MDFLHPNKSGYDLLGVKIGTWMETMSQDDSRPLPWIIGGAVLVVVIAAIIVLIVVKRKRRQQAVQ
jgi:membrane protein DedA with SNARE-associated domain